MAILFEEPEAPELVARLGAAGAKRISAVNYLECAIELDNAVEGGLDGARRLPRRRRHRDRRGHAAQARAARLAHRRFGRGRHRARLNLGDCFAYALAREAGEPLLAKGDDFPATDLALVR